MFRIPCCSLRHQRCFSTAVAPSSSEVVHSDPFAVLSLPGDATRDQLRDKFFELAKTQHPELTGDKRKFQDVVDAYEEAIQIADQKHPIAPWDGISPMTYAQAWQGKDHWRKLWEEHWATRLAHMYKHHSEMTELEANLKWREAQYMQVRDWMVLAKDVLDLKTKAEWREACDLARDMMLWLRTNKSNYRRYFISNQNVAINMHDVYQEHEMSRQLESIQWAEWDAFFAKASAWAAENESRIRDKHSMVGPLATKFEYLFRGRYQYAIMPMEEKMLQREKEEPIYNRLFWKAELLKAIRFNMRQTERFGRALFPVLMLAVFVGYLTDFQLLAHWLDVTISDTGALEIHNRRMDLVDWALAGTPKPEKMEGAF